MIEVRDFEMIEFVMLRWPYTQQVHELNTCNASAQDAAVWSDVFMCVTWLNYFWHDLFRHVNSKIKPLYDVTQNLQRHGSRLHCVTWLIYFWHDLFRHVNSKIKPLYDVTQNLQRHGSRLHCVTWLSNGGDMTYSYVKWRMQVRKVLWGGYGQ